MRSLFITSLFLFLCVFTECSHSQTQKLPTVGISVLVRNKGHTLPYFLTCIEKLEYPKDRMYIWFSSDNNEDNTEDIIEAWVKHFGQKYQNIYINLEPKEESYISAKRWDNVHFRHVIEKREKALNFARARWADFMFMIDADVILTNRATLLSLLAKNKTIVAPMLISDGLYSNFWCGMTENYYYARTKDYKPILNYESVGCFDVPMVHSAVLINLNELSSDVLTYNPENIPDKRVPVDDIISFAISAMINDISMTICNDASYGYITMPIEEEDTTMAVSELEKEQLINIKLEAIMKGITIPLDPLMAEHVQRQNLSRFGLDHIFLINLERRQERRNLMQRLFHEIGMEVSIVNAIDGQRITPADLNKLGVKLMRNYEDPFHKRAMKMGEIGCFLSHYYIWKEISDKNYERSLIFEDDVKFNPNFRSKLMKIMKELEQLDWDLVYIGRKILQEEEEQKVTKHIVRPRYSYWTLGYIISLRGARKLLDAKPLENLLPVDEFLPIMFNQHPNKTWKAYFEPRNLKAYSASPLLITPTHYTGQSGYISDTELSDIAPNVVSTVHANVHTDL